MKQKKGYCVAVLKVIAISLFFFCVYTYMSTDRKGPTINFSNERIVYTDNTDSKQLLQGVKAVDDKDGNVTSTLRISSVIENDSETKVTVEYIARDKSNNITKTSRMYDYHSSETADNK